MLPPANRLTRSVDFTTTVRSGRRVRSGNLVVHQLPSRADSVDAVARVGFVVSKAVGGSVTRHRVTRRLRSGVRPRLAQLPAGSDLVVRALPGAAEATFHDLTSDFERAATKLARS